MKRHKSLRIICNMETECFYIARTWNISCNKTWYKILLQPKVAVAVNWLFMHATVVYPAEIINFNTENVFLLLVQQFTHVCKTYACQTVSSL